jgi:hypothetical protein
VAYPKGFQKIGIRASDGAIYVYAGRKIAATFETQVKEPGMVELLAAFYREGEKSGRREMIERMDQLKVGVNYLPPGQPKKQKRS